VPRVQENVLRAETDPLRHQQMAEPDLIDEELDFGDMHMGLGYAFPLSEAEASAENSIPTAKSWACSRMAAGFWWKKSRLPDAATLSADAATSGRGRACASTRPDDPGSPPPPPPASGGKAQTLATPSTGSNLPRRQD